MTTVAADTTVVTDLGFAGPDTLRIDLIGGLRVQVGSKVLGPRQLGGAKPRHLLIALALARGLPVSKERLVSILWDDVRPVACAATIETYVCVLRKHLQTSTTVRGGPIETRAGCYSLDMSRVDLDLVSAARDVSRALHPSMSAQAALPLLRQALLPAGVPLLPDEQGGRWLDAARRKHEQVTREWLVNAAEKVVAVAPDEAAQWARQVIDADPLDESAWHVYLLSKVIGGRTAEGLRAYDSCRRTFAEELGCAPGTRLQEMYGRLLGDAHHADQDLEQLIEAVIRLHRATGDAHPGGSSRPGLSLENARRALSALLHDAAGTQPRLIHSATA